MEKTHHPLHKYVIFSFEGVFFKEKWNHNVFMAYKFKNHVWGMTCIK
jgi:hypothetical protein